jgi:hypothetical protein
MATNDLAIHQTISNRIQGEDGDAWEFACPICAYRVRYIVRHNDGGQELEILDSGDPRARHIGYHVQAKPIERLVENEDDDESWLTPELRRQMEELLEDVDMGEGGS